MHARSSFPSSHLLSFFPLFLVSSFPSSPPPCASDLLHCPSLPRGPQQESALWHWIVVLCRGAPYDTPPAAATTSSISLALTALWHCVLVLPPERLAVPSPQSATPALLA